MQLEDHLNIYNSLSKKNRKGRIGFLDAPTGSGKSHTVISFLCNQAISDPTFRAFFVTDQKKNLDKDKFKKSWEKYKLNNDELFFKRVAVFRSLEDTVGLVIEDFKKRKIPKRLLNKRFEYNLKKLNKAYDIYKLLLRDSDEDSEIKSYWSSLLKAESQFRHDLLEAFCIDRNIKLESFEKIEFQKKIKENLNSCPEDIQEWIYKIYPTINLDTFQIFLCTTDKFIRSYISFFENKSVLFEYSKLIEGSLIVFDEVDTSKKILWNKSIDDACKNSVDLIMLFDDIYSGMKRVEIDFPIGLRNILVEQKIYSNLLKNATELNSKYYLSYLYKIRGFKNSKNYIINTPLSTIFSNDVKWYSHFLKDQKQVIVNKIKNEDLNFNLMLIRVTKFIKRFNKFIFICSQKYMNSENLKKTQNTTAMTQPEAYNTIYSALRLKEEHIRMLSNIGVDVVGNLTIKKHDNNILDDFHEFQKNGLNLFLFEDSNEHNLQTKINSTILNSTAENYILRLAKKSMIYGLSATANIPTVLDNYDLNYLKNKLGEDFIDCRKLLTSQTVEEFDYNKRYAEKNINVKSVLVGSKDTIEETIKSIISVGSQKKVDWNKIRKLDSDLQENLNKIKSSDEREMEKNAIYYQRRYISLFESFIRFALNPKLISFLGLQAKLPDDESKMSKCLIETVFNTICKQLSFETNGEQRLFIIMTKNGEIQNQMEVVHEYLKKPNARAYLLSAYLSIGVGQNLQHPITQQEKSIVKNIGPNKLDLDKRLDEVDLAGIYLGPVTHIFSKINDFGFNSSLIKYITQLEYLRDVNEISAMEEKTLFKKIENHDQDLFQPKNILSVRASYVRTIVQALGRMNRTFNKIQNPIVMAHEDVFLSVSYLGIEKERFSPEYNSLLSEDSNIKIDENINNKIKQSEKSNLTMYTYHDLEQLKRGFRVLQDFADDYQKAREILLRYPTINEQQLAQYQLNLHKCMQYLPNTDNENHYVATSEFMQSGEFKFGDIENTANKFVVSSKAAGLDIILKYPGMKEFFNDRGYATRWDVTDKILNPVQFINLYCGYLGEVAGKFIMEDAFPIELEELPGLENNELFDFKIKNENIAIDFKNWKQSHFRSETEARKHVRRKLDKLNENIESKWSVIVINIIEKNNISVVKTVDDRIMEVSALINKDGKLVLSSENKKMIGEFLIGKE